MKIPREWKNQDAKEGRLEKILILSIMRVVTIVTLQAGGGGIVDRMAIGAGCMFMVGTITIAATGMIEGGIPIAGIVALCAGCSELSGMKRWFSVTGNASRGKSTINAA